MKKCFKESEALLARAEKVIPLGSQTFSKSRAQYPYGISPYFIERGEGCRVWDVDGNEYIDVISALLCVTLGYNDQDVNEAVKKQLDNGVSFSLPHRLEMEVAELLVELVPCAEMVRFGKNGSDATSAAVRLARAYTQRDHVAVCGYHGWQDWYIGSTSRNLGVPEVTQQLTHTFNYNDIDSLKHLFASHPGQVGAVIMEPMNVAFPEEGFLEAVKSVAHENGALLIFDETITGCRLTKGGAQELFGVTPDLSTLGKGLANGFPLSAIVGRADIMKLMEDIFYSGTFGGETISLAAAKAVLTKIKQEPILESIKVKGQILFDGLENVISENQLEHIFHVSGHPSWSFLNIKPHEHYSVWEIKTLYLQEMLARGVLCLGAHNLNYAHLNEDIDALLTVYSEVLPLIGKAIEARELVGLLRAEPLTPLFKVR